MGNEKVTIAAVVVAVLAVLSLPVAYSMGRNSHTVAIEMPKEVVQFAQNIQAAQTKSAEVAAGATLTIHAKGPWQSDNQFVRPNAGTAFYAVDVEVTNGSTTSCHLNPFAFTIRDTANREYKDEPMSPDPAMAMRTLAPGQSARGWLCFALPTGATPTKLVFTPGLGGAAAETAL